MLDKCFKICYYIYNEGQKPKRNVSRETFNYESEVLKHEKENDKSAS